MRTSRAVLLLLAAAGGVQLVWSYPTLPETMASHFDGTGRPDGFQSRDGFVALAASMLGIAVLIPVGLGALFRRIPPAWFNLPNRDYWLAPEQREETLDAISTQLDWFGAASLALYLIVIQMVVATNRSSAPRLDSKSMFIVLGLYLLFTGVWLARFLLRFKKPQGVGIS